MPKQNVRLITPVTMLYRLDLEPAQKSLILPYNESPGDSNPIYLLDGEFITLNEQHKASREGPVYSGSYPGGGDPTKNPTDAGAVSKAPWYLFWLERGRTDMQAAGKVTYLHTAGYEADFSPDVVGNVTYQVGNKLYVNWLSTGNNRNRRRGLTTELNSGDASSAVVHAFVTRVYPAGSEFKIRAVIIAP